ncbi:hypothetical protein ACPA5B_20545 [Pseudomonas solani]|uniref:hypothetical protein n=1 Tax=Pseudomonas solani TaxID=2731552 RepID=UPI003C2C091F
MNFKPLYLSVAFLGAVWAFYFWNFHGEFSTSQGDWGTFGDFTGGVLNPLLNFITIYILITQFVKVREDLDRQRFDESVKAFEGSFFTFTTIALNEYKAFEIESGGRIYKGAEAVGFIESYFEQVCNSKQDIYLKLAELDQACNDSIFALVSSFCVVFKLISDSCPDRAKDKYISLFSMLLPSKVTYLLCMAEVATRWKLLSYPRELNYFNKESVAKVMVHYRREVGLSRRGVGL